MLNTAFLDLVLFLLSAPTRYHTKNNVSRHLDSNDYCVNILEDSDEQGVLSYNKTIG